MSASASGQVTQTGAILRIRPPKQLTTQLEPENTITGTIEPGRDSRLSLPGTILKRKYKV